MGGPQGAYPKRSSSEAQHGTSTCNRVFVVSPPSYQGIKSWSKLHNIKTILLNQTRFEFFLVPKYV